MKLVIKLVIAAFVLALLLVAGLVAAALFSGDTDEPMVLRGAMKTMNSDFLAVQKALQAKDWTALAKYAKNLEAHPEPPLLEKIKIIGFLKSDARQFRGYDLDVKQAAKELERAARRRNMIVARQAIDSMNRACNGCHNDFRGAYLEQFY